MRHAHSIANFQRIRHLVVVSTIGLALLLACTSAARAADPPRPNIVFILADDVGCEPLGCYGGTSYKTPQLDRLAAGGLKFTHAYSMPVCHPSRVCLLTGRYPRRLGNPKWGSFPKELETQTLAHVLKRAGYATAVAGKWQLALLGKDLDHPHRLGFDAYSLFGWHEGARYHDPLIWENGARRTGTEGKYGPDLYVEFLVDFIERNRERPFFVFYSMALCHDVTDDLKTPVPYVPGNDRYMNYAEMVASMDRSVGRLVGALDRLGLREQTLVLFTGDNGTASRSILRAERSNESPKKWRYVREPVYSEIDGRRVRGGKGSLSDGGTRVPLIASWPGRIAPGQTVDDLVDFSDFLPTFAALAGGAPPDGVRIDGQSFAPRLLGAGPGPRTWAYSESKGRFWVRTQRWKLTSGGKLYNMGSDPDEKKNLADTELTAEAAGVRRRLQAVVDSF